MLSAVFLPMAFFGGSTGVIYRQFSITIITAMLLSAAVALILTPALCASLLRPHDPRGGIAPARWFNAGFGRMTAGYAGIVGRTLRRPFVMIVLLVAMSLGAAQVYKQLTSSFVPTEDQGTLMAMISLQDGATTAQTAVALDAVETYLREEEGATVKSVFANLGFSFGGSGQNAAMAFIRLRDFAERPTPELSASAVVARANAHFAGYRAGRIIFTQPPAIQGLGNSAGFSMYLVDQSGAGTDALSDAADALVASAETAPEVQDVRRDGASESAALKLEIDQQKAESFGLNLSQINAMLPVIFSGTEVNDFALGASLAAGDRAGGGRKPDAAIRHRSVVRAQRSGRDGAVPVLHDDQLAARGEHAGAL